MSQEELERKELLQIVMSKKETRVKYCEHDFLAWCLYYFPDAFYLNIAEFHKDFARALSKGENILFEGFRSCGKTVFVKYFIVWCIAYRKHRYIVFFANDKSKSEAKLFDIAIYLQTNKKLINDYGQLFYDDNTDILKKSKRKTVGEFITSNQVKVQAMGMGETARGMVYGAEDGTENRISLIIFDDIDNDNTVFSEKILENNYNFIKSEVFGGLAVKNQRIFLCNVIAMDGVGVRFKRDYKGVWTIFEVFYSEDRNPRPEFFTPETITLLKADGETAWGQNYCGLPYTGKGGIVHRKFIQYYNYDIEFDYITMAVDPAISNKTHTDLFAIVVTGVKGDNYYIMDVVGLDGLDKNPDNAIKEVKRLYKLYNANNVIVESTAFQAVLASLLRGQEMAITEIKPHKDKVTRLSEHLSKFETGKVYFKEGRCEKLVDQLINFPNAKHDDYVDAMVYSLGKKKKNRFYLTTI